MLGAKVLNIPNVISLLRIALIVVFAILFIRGADGWAIAVLAGAGVSDFLDGYLARRLNQVTELGRILDPAADRLLTIAVVLALFARGILPIWLVVGLLLRDVLVGIALLIGRIQHRPAPQVTYIGKVATFILYIALPLTYLTWQKSPGWYAFALVGATIGALCYWWSAKNYIAVALGRKPKEFE